MTSTDGGYTHTKSFPLYDGYTQYTKFVACKSLSNQAISSWLPVSWLLQPPQDQPCAGLDLADIEAPIIPSDSTPREGLRIKVCNVMAFDDNTVRYAITAITGNSDLTYLNNTPVPTPTQIETAYDYFFPGKTTSSAALSAILDLAAAAQEANKPLDPWRYAILSLCYAPDQQMP
jgi:hypothetical protein